MNNLKRASVVVEDEFGVCLWEMPGGLYLGDGEGHFLSAYGKVQDPIIEQKMLVAAVAHMGDEAREGKPFWMPGSRKVTDNEHDDQMERMLDGKIPDIADQAAQLARR